MEESKKYNKMSDDDEDRNPFNILLRTHEEDEEEIERMQSQESSDEETDEEFPDWSSQILAFCIYRHT